MAFKHRENPVSEKVLAEMESHLYSYQKETIKNTLKKLSESDKMIGQIILPTGAGKTKVAEYLTAKFLNEVYMAYNRPSICGIACHRIILANNLLERILNTLSSKVNADFEVIVVNSGDYSDFISELNEKYNKHVNAINIKDFTKESFLAYQNAVLNQGKHIFFVMLYHSLEHCINLNVKFDFVFCDEAHTSVEKQHFEKMEKFVKNSEVVIHMTATPVETSNGKDMKHAKYVYGDIIIEKHPRELVLDKYICPINVVLQQTLDKSDEIKDRKTLFSSTNSVIKSIMASATSLFERVKQNQINAKIPKKDRKKGVLFVTVNGNKYLTEIIEGNSKQKQKFDEWRNNNDVDLYIISAEKKGWIDYSETPEMIGNEVGLGKEAFLEKLMEINKVRHNNTIIIFIDMLAEGIDLPDINGVLLLRSFDDNAQKIIQVVGRSIRRDDMDRKLITDDSVKYDDFDKFRKPCAYVYIPYVNFSKYESDYILDTMLKLYNEYGDIVFFHAIKEDKNGEEEKLCDNPSFLKKAENKNIISNFSFNKNKIKEIILNLMCNNEISFEDKKEYIMKWASKNALDLESNKPIEDYLFFKEHNFDINVFYDFLTVKYCSL